MTSYRRINSRTINRDVQQQDNMVVFNRPLSRAIYPNYFSVPDASNTCLLVSTGSKYSATAAPKLTFDGTVLDISANLNVAGNVDVSGTILANQFLSGQVINTELLDFIDLSQTVVDISNGETKTIFRYLYTPTSDSSSFSLDYQTNYSVGGSAGDSVEAYMYVKDISENRIALTRQVWNAGAGGGTRSGTILPIVGRYDNYNMNTKEIRVDIYNVSESGGMSVSADISTWLKLTEFGRAPRFTIYDGNFEQKYANRGTYDAGVLTVTSATTVGNDYILQLNNPIYTGYLTVICNHFQR